MKNLVFVGKSSATVVIPGTVRVVGNGAFQECSMPSAVIPEGVEEIGEKAFYLSSARYVSVPETVKNISFAAFASMPSLEEMTLPKFIETIDKRAFYKCPVLKKVVLPDGLKSIADEAFYGCTVLETVNVPGSVETFGSDVFDRCNNLSLSVDKSAAIYEDIIRQYSGNIAPDWLWPEIPAVLSRLPPGEVSFYVFRIIYFLIMLFLAFLLYKKLLICAIISV